MDLGGRGIRVRVKNRAPAPIQITAEQILLEAKERQEDVVRAPHQKITDAEELAEFRMRKRKEFEDSIRRQRQHIGTWIKYATWEEGQKEFERARSVFERALDVEATNQGIWMKYAMMEMKNKFINRARNVWDRAVTLLPRVDLLWYRYAYMEEMVGNVNNARKVFERWMRWEPQSEAWLAYIKLETRSGEIERARAVYERYVACAMDVRAFLRLARWEEKQKQFALARRAYERACDELEEEEQDERLFINFAGFETRQKEYERARAVYRYAIDKIPRDLAKDLNREFIAFEKQFGDRDGIESVIMGKRRQQYEDAVTEKPLNYDAWFDYTRLEENAGDHDRVRKLYARAVANKPPAPEKRFWRRYVYLWINWALFEELEAQDAERTRGVYRDALAVIPHKVFTFAKLWVMAAEHEIRRGDLDAARKILGRAIGMCPKEKLFKSYIELELKLGNVDRCRTLYGKYLDTYPTNCYAWSKFAEMEATLDERERAAAIYELAVQQPVLDMPEVLWKAYIDFAIDGGDFDLGRELYKRLLERTSQIKVWLAYATFEATHGDLDKARQVYKEADAALKRADSKEERALLLQAWRAFEQALGEDNATNLKNVESKLPKRIKKKREILAEDGSTAGWEEYHDYIFPDDTKGQGSLKLLQLAAQFSKTKSLAGLKRKAPGGVPSEAAPKTTDTPDGEPLSGGGGGGGGGGGEEPMES